VPGVLIWGVGMIVWHRSFILAWLRVVIGPMGWCDGSYEKEGCNQSVAYEFILPILSTSNSGAHSSSSSRTVLRRREARLVFSTLSWIH